MGPLPAEVYWRRRWVAVVSTLLAVLAIVWTIAALLAPVEPEPEPVGQVAATTSEPAHDPAVVAVPPPAPPTIPASPSTAPQAAGPTPPSSSGRHGIGQEPPPARPAEPAGSAEAAASPGPVSPAGPTDPAAGPAGPDPAGPDPAGPGPAVPGPAVPGPAEPAGPNVDLATTEQLRPDDTVRRTGPAPTPVPVPATGPVPCTNAMLGVTAEVAPPTHRVTDRPVLRLIVTNTSAQPCVRDLDPARQEIVVWGMDGSRLWSSNDCSTAAGVDLHTLVPAQPVVFAVNWAGRTSTPGCSARRSTVPAGSYNVLTRVDDVISPPAAMTRTA